DLMRRASRRLICQPAAVSGEEVAARAQQRYPYASRDPYVTGSLGGRKEARHRRDRVNEGDEIEDEERPAQRRGGGCKWGPALRRDDVGMRCPILHITRHIVGHSDKEQPPAVCVLWGWRAFVRCYGAACNI